MFGIILSAFLLSVSLCADCLAVSICSSISSPGLKMDKILPTALVFGVVQAGLFLLGWGFGDLFVGMIEKVSHWIGFLLLAYVGGSMIAEGIKGDEEGRNLEGLRNIILGAVATSIDAFAVGVSLSMDRPSVQAIVIDAIGIFLVTVLSVVIGLSSGSRIGRKFGSTAEIVGGVVLVCIGLNILLGII